MTICYYRLSKICRYLSGGDANWVCSFDVPFPKPKTLPNIKIKIMFHYCTPTKTFLMGLCLFGLVTMMGARAQTLVVSESFTSNTVTGWTLGGVGYTPNLTATNGDANGSGWLRLTDTGNNIASYAVYNDTIFSANTEIKINFDFAMWKTAPAGIGADGIGFFLYDGSVPFAIGASGGSLGYAQKNVSPISGGLAGGYLGIGIDSFGNYSNPTEGRVGGPGVVVNSVAVRGPGSGQSGYEYLAGTTSLTTALDFPTYRPTNAVDNRNIQIYLTRDNILTVSMKYGTNTYVDLFTTDLSAYTRPDTLGFGFFGGTGGSVEYHDIRNVTITNVTAFQWDNDAANGLWTVSNNWVGPRVTPTLCSITNTVNTNTTGTTPTAGADILFGDTYIASNQLVNLGGGTVTNRAIQFDGAYSYTITNGTLYMDGRGMPGDLQIRTSNNSGDAAHNISANIVMSTNMVLDADAENFLTVLSGTLDNGGFSLQSTGVGNAQISGNITNNGSVSQTGPGLLVLSGSNTYSGGTRLSAGTLGIGSSNALGTSTLTVQGSGGNILAYSGSRAISNNINLLANLRIGGTNALTLNGAMTNNGANRILYVTNTASTVMNGAMFLSEGATARTQTLDVVATASPFIINGVLQNGTGGGVGSITKEGDGIVVLGGSNTFTGTTTINGGILRISSSDRLSDNSSMNLIGGKFDLAGTNSERILTLSFNEGLLDFGTAGTSNSFMFSNAGTAGGPLVVRNQSAGDRLAFLTSGSNSVTAAVRNNIYFSGEGSGAITSAPNQTITGYGSTWTFLTGPTNTWNVWDGGGGDNNLNTANNWVSNVAPPSATTTRISFEGTVRTNGPVVNANRNVNVIRFNTNAGTFVVGSGSQLRFGGTLPSIIQMSTNNQTISGTIRLDSASTIMDVSGTGDLTLSGVISENVTAGFYKYGDGRLILSGANTFNGAVSIQEGVVNVRSAQALGDNGNAVTVHTGAGLEIQGGITLANYNLSIEGTGQNENGALRNISGNNTIANNITLTRDARIQSDTNTLTLSGNINGTNTTVTAGGNGNITFSGIIQTGLGNFTKNGTGTVTFSGTSANTYTGETEVVAGNLNLNKTAGVNATAGLLRIGGTGTVNLLANNQISDSSVVHIENSGTLNLSNSSETLGYILADAGTTVNLSSVTSVLTISNALGSLMNGNVTGTGALTKLGNGKLTLGASNSYTGVTTLSDGVLRVSDSYSLGATNGATTVASGSSLEIARGNTDINIRENLTIIGTGVAVEGALRNLQGSNTWSGNITVGTGGASINSDRDVFTIAGTVTSADQSLTNGGFGNTIFASNMNLGTGNFVKTGPGHTILSNMNVTATQTRLTEGSMIIKGMVTNSGAMTVNFGTSLCIDTTDVTNGNIFRVNGNFTNAGTINLKKENGGSMSANTNGFQGIEFAGTTFTNTGTILWSFDAPPSGITSTNIYYGGFRSSNNIFAAYQNGSGFFTSGFQAVGLNADQYLKTTFVAGYYYLAVIPEPSTYGLMIIGMAMSAYGIFIARRKKAALRNR